MEKRGRRCSYQKNPVPRISRAVFARLTVFVKGARLRFSRGCTVSKVYKTCPDQPKTPFNYTKEWMHEEWERVFKLSTTSTNSESRLDKEDTNKGGKGNDGSNDDINNNDSKRTPTVKGRRQ
jgi:hypothetical protein